MAQPYIISIILNTNRREDTLECLRSLRAQTYPHHKALVLDNASTDGSVAAIAAQHPEAEVLAITENRGYTGNNNVGITEALRQGADWLLVLNEDTVLAPECLAELVAVGESNPRVGIVGPMIYHHDEPTVIQSAGGSFGTAWESIHVAANEEDRQQFTTPRPVDWVSGCAVFIRRAAVEQVGALDDRFFYYWEEFEWCLRTGRAGWTLMHAPAARLWHKGVNRNYQPKPSVGYYNTRNRLLMLQKHHAPLPYKMRAWTEVLRTLASYTLRPKWRHKRAHRDAIWRGMVDYLRGNWGQARL
jgi:GT2 family glycosyltransferase